jgi:hypothetical protein
VHSFGNALNVVELTDLLGSGSVEALACCGWTLLVCLPSRGHSSIITVANYNNLMLHFQLGVRRYSRLRVECHPKASPLPLDYLGP